MIQNKNKNDATLYLNSGDWVGNLINLDKVKNDKYYFNIKKLIMLKKKMFSI